ncbi:MAG: TM2 domain-containing protein [Candidatus Obscuribacterales bacterium]|nr:TM2 domain-containing protein [Candidatus Obscuribacterales bacterium]
MNIRPVKGDHMHFCAKCRTSLTSKNQTCPVCAPQIANRAPTPDELAVTYAGWLERGKEALSSGAGETAVLSFREAVRCSRTLPEPDNREIESRLLLAQALEAANKAPEAADQYRIIAQATLCPEMHEAWLKRSQDLMAASTHLTFAVLFKNELFRPPTNEEGRYLSLYCANCKRLFAEAEIYQFRHGGAKNISCWCGTAGEPLVKDEGSEDADITSGQRARALIIADSVLPNGKKQLTACLLTLFSGFCGGHKFYLNDTVSGWIYLLWSWTLIPLALSFYDFLILARMTTVNFNMTYNLDLVLRQILLDESALSAKIDKFVQEPTTNNEHCEA